MANSIRLLYIYMILAEYKQKVSGRIDYNSGLDLLHVWGIEYGYGLQIRASSVGIATNFKTLPCGLPQCIPTASLLYSANGY